MRWVQDALADFGRQLGIDGLGLGAHGLVQLRLQSGGLLAVEPVRRGEIDEVLVYLGRPLGFEGSQRLRAALAQAHHRHGGTLAVQVAVRGSGPEALLLALVRLPQRAFTVQALGHAVDYLRRWLDETAPR